MGSSIKYGEFISVNTENKDETKEYICLNTPVKYNSIGGIYGDCDYYKWRFEDFLDRHKDCKHLPPVYYFGPLRRIINSISDATELIFLESYKYSWSVVVNTEVWDGDYPKYDKGTPIVRESYGYKYCIIFSNRLMPNLSQEGQDWLIKAKKLLQMYMDDGLCDKYFESKYDTEYNKLVEDKGLSEVELDSNWFKRFAFGTHPDAYLDAGLLYLINSDKIQIALTPDFIEWVNKETWEQAGIVTQEEVNRYRKMVESSVKIAIEIYEKTYYGLEYIRNFLKDFDKPKI